VPGEGGKLDTDADGRLHAVFTFHSNVDLVDAGINQISGTYTQGRLLHLPIKAQAGSGHMVGMKQLLFEFFVFRTDISIFLTPFITLGIARPFSESWIGQVGVFEGNTVRPPVSGNLSDRIDRRAGPLSLRPIARLIGASELTGLTHFICIGDVHIRNSGNDRVYVVEGLRGGTLKVIPVHHLGGWERSGFVKGVIVREEGTSDMGELPCGQLT
jgi:hypothetical protein